MNLGIALMVLMLGMVIATLGVGLFLLFQGNSLRSPEQQQRFAGKMVLAGKIWIGLACLLLAALIYTIIISYMVATGLLKG